MPLLYYLILTLTLHMHVQEYNKYLSVRTKDKFLRFASTIAREKEYDKETGKEKDKENENRKSSNNAHLDFAIKELNCLETNEKEENLLVCLFYFYWYYCIHLLFFCTYLPAWLYERVFIVIFNCFLSLQFISFHFN